jgi:BNR/Asp-box repeat
VAQGLIPRVAFAASKPSVGYACTSGSGGALQISKTSDGGATWKSLSSPLSGAFCVVTVNPTNSDDILVNDGNSFTNVIVRSRDGGVTWQKKNGVTLAFQNWGWAGSTLLVATILTESQEPLTALYKSVNGGPFVQVDQQGQLAGVKLGMPSFVGGTASQLYVQSGTAQLSDPVSVEEETFTSRDGGATWQKVTFAGGAVHLLGASADGRALVGLASDDLTRVEVSLDAGQTWRKLPAKLAGVPGFGALYVTPDGSVIATSQRQGMVDRPDNRIFLARPCAAHVECPSDPAGARLPAVGGGGWRRMAPVGDRPRSGPATPPTIAGRPGACSRIHSHKALHHAAHSLNAYT